MAADLLVVGLDLVTGREVHAEDRRTEDWRKKGHNGDCTLVCLACYEGADLPDGPRTVALVPKGREGAMLRVSPVIHVIRTMERIRAGRPREIELRYGGARSLDQMPSACATEGSSPS